ncbi:protein rolling stone isoform X1 [Spodoptera frugiperda]|uniref:Protein rolling stone isoform X1 n=1 Tax=Spodoptera frugiperda TaxID=7108 RepID=A0A2H1V2M7_SPOFR|nr:protein rolling stone isoform X1 [Spodoptera frugiperda]
MLCVGCARAECRWRMCLLEHPSPSNFYVSCWQSSRSAAPLLLLRTFLFLFSTCVLLASIAVPLTLNKHFGHWFIYLTHWGFLLIVLTTGFGTSVSAYAFYKKPIDATFGLPWYVKTYWILYNITIPVSFLITVFYWGILKTSANTVNFAPNPVLDIMLHGVNSAVMLVELVCSAHPSRLMHVMQPLYFAGAYMLFSVIYFFAGGLDPWGNPFIYPVVDWSKPEQTMVVITLTALFLALMHVLTVGIATARDAIAKRRDALTTGVYNDAFTP